MNPVSLIVYPVADIAAATNFYTTWLATEPYVESPYYTGFKTGAIEIGLVPKGAQAAPLAYVDVTDIHAALQALLAHGAQTLQDVTDVAQGLLVASVKTADGTAVGLRQFP